MRIKRFQKLRGISIYDLASTTDWSQNVLHFHDFESVLYPNMIELMLHLYASEFLSL